MSKDIVSALMEKCTVLECFAKVRQSSPDNIKNEISFNLLEDLSKLYISVHTFSFIKGKFQAFKIRISKKKKKKKKKSTSLRTGMKQSTSFIL